MDRGRPARITTEPVGWHSRGYVPHLDVPEVVQHVVFRLADSLPRHVRQDLLKRPVTERAEAADAALDIGYGRRDLASLAIAALVENALLRFDAGSVMQ